MLGTDTVRNSVIRATMELAEQKDWSAISYQEIAEVAQCSLSDLYSQFTSKQQILDAFFAEVDSAVLKSIRHGSEDREPAKDRLFDVIMTRFEVMQPYKLTLKKLTSQFKCGRHLDLISLKRLHNSNVWMLSAAGVRSGGKAGKLRSAGLSALYFRVLPIWFEDEDPGLAKTMSTLDKRLQEGEKWLKRADKLFEKAYKWRSAFKKSESTQSAGKKTEDSPDFASSQSGENSDVGDQPEALPTNK